MAVAIVESRKRSLTPYLDEPPYPPHLSKRTRHSADDAAAAAAAMAALQQQSFVYDPMDALLLIFPGADRHVLQQCFEASGRSLPAAVSAFRDSQVRHAAASEMARAAQADRTDECADIFVRQMAAASDPTDAKNRAVWLLDMVKQPAAIRASSDAVRALGEENGALKGQVAALLRDNAVLKRAVAIQHDRQRGCEERARELEQLKNSASEHRQKIAALEMKNFALSARLKDAESCNAMAGGFHRPHPDVF